MNLNPGSLFSLLAFMAMLIVLLLLMRVGRSAFRPEPGETAATWKFRTVIYTALAFIVPLWPLSFPLFVLLAHRSYLAGQARQLAAR